MNSSVSTLKVNLSSIRANYNIIKQKCSKAKIAISIKANAYGLGFAPIAKILESEGCADFFVASLAEGIELRKILGEKGNIYIFNGVFESEAKDFIFHHLIPVLNTLNQIKLWQNLAQQLNSTLPCILHFNTALNRFGIVIKDNDFKLLAQDILNSNIEILYVMSHLVSAEEPENNLNKLQLEKFQHIAEFFPNIKKSFANSSGIFLGPEYQFDLVRPGAAIYGLNPIANNTINNPMQNCITLLSPIIQIQELEAGESIGYNSTYITTKHCKIATIPIGYGDGYLRSLSNNGIVFIKGQEAKVVGRISMDLMTIDVSDIDPKNLFIGSMVEVIGDNITPDMIAKLSGTNSYEIITRLGNRLERRYN